jgi:septal ring factor EnvC (AmiA/AmiB activator)
MRHLTVIIFFAACIAAGALSVSAEDSAENIDSTSRKLDAVEGRISNTQGRIDKVVRKEKSILGSLETLDREISAIRVRVGNLRNDERDLTENIALAEARLKEIRGEREQIAGRLSSRSAALYKAGRVSYLGVVLNAADLEDLQRRSYYLKRLARYDSDLFTQATNLYRNEQQQTERLRATKTRLVSARRDLETSLSALSGKKQDKNLLLAQVRDEKKKNALLLRELESSASHLKDLLDALRREAETGESAFATLRGSLKRPVAGKVVVAFGQNRSEKFNTYTLSNGVTIQSAEGTPVRAVYGGRILFADWLRGYGRIIIVDHGGNYYTLYGHLSDLKVQVGQDVEADKIIGLVGDSGSLEGPALYFEIRHHGKPMDPGPWFSG